MKRALPWLVIIPVLIALAWFAFGSRWYWEARAEEATQRVRDACFNGTRADFTRELIEAKAVFRNLGANEGWGRELALENELRAFGCVTRVVVR